MSDSALNEKECRRPGCSNTFLTDAPARKFCDEHATGKPKQEAPDATINQAFTRFVVPLMVDENQLDELWHKMPIEEKALAIQLYWDNLEA